MDFVVIDVETANADLSSICQVGIASFHEGQLADAWVSLVNPESDFSPFNITVHGIDEDQVQQSPNWAEVFPEVAARLTNQIVVSHTPFDQRALARACDRFDLAECECNWLDSARVVRMTWPQFSKAGYGLPKMAAYFGIDYQAHDALEDARCAGLLLLRAVAETGRSPEQWLTHVKKPIPSADRGNRSHSWPGPSKRAGNPKGKLFGENLVFTGSLSMPRNEAADAAAAIGCNVEDGVTKRTTMLVVSDQELRGSAGYPKSSKRTKAERLIGNGQPIRILGESEFKRILSSN